MNQLRELLASFGQQHRGYVWLAFVLAANALVYGGLTFRLSDKQEGLSSEQQRVSTELNNKKQELARISGDYQVVLNNRETVSRFFDEVVQTRVPGLTEAWDEIDELARQTGVLRGRTSYDRELLEIGLEQVQARMPVEGNYFDLVRFLNRLERSPRFFLVEEVRIAQRQNDNQDIQLDCSISFFLRPGLALGGVTQQVSGR